MKLIKSEKLENNQHELQFSIDAETFAKAVDAAFKRESKKYSVPGFRKGKAPRAMIEKMYGGDIFEYDAVNDLFPVEYDAAVVESAIEPVDSPEVDIVSMNAGEDVVLKAIVTVKPDVKVGNYVGLKATKIVHDIDEAQVDAEISRMQERNARIITREGKAEDGDIVDIDFDGYVDGVAFEGGKAEHFSLTLGSGQFIPGFEEQVVGHAAGEEFDVTVKFPDDYQAKELEGKEAVFKIKLHEVKYKEMPALDDEFAKDVSEFDTLADLKANIRKGLEEQQEKQAEMQVENDLVEQLVDSMEGDIPAAMFETRVDEMVRDFEYRLQQQGLRLQDYMKYLGQDMATFRASFKEQAEKQVKMRLALEKIAAQEKIEATEEDLENEVKRLADAYQMEVDKIREMIPVAEVKKDLAVNKAIDFIKSKAKVAEKKAEEVTKKAEKAVSKKKDKE